jgi:hypothetical protein
MNKLDIKAPDIWGYNLKTVDDMQLLGKSEAAIFRTMIADAVCWTITGGGSMHHEIRSMIQVDDKTSYKVFRDDIHRTMLRVRRDDGTTDVSLLGIYTTPAKAFAAVVDHHSQSLRKTASHSQK